MASALRVAGGPALHSLPTYHGLFLASGVITGAALAGLAAILLFGTQSIAVPAAAAIGAAGTGAALYPRIASAFRARNLSARCVLAVLGPCSAVAALTTSGIVFSVVFETIIFFRQVSPVEFLFSAQWSPTSTPASFGILPLLVGTLLITFIAILVAGPLGLLSAIYMAEYASARMRGVRACSRPRPETRARCATTACARTALRSTWSSGRARSAPGSPSMSS